MIIRRKHPVFRATRLADPRAVGFAMVSLAAMNPASAAEPATAAEPQVMQRVTVRDDAEDEGYKAEAASSPKFTQPLLDTPQTITVLKSELLEDQGVATLSEALRNVPGITFTMGENGNTTTGDSVFMRGFDTSGSIFVDGIRDLGTVSRDTFNIEQVEIVKGPSGADNGRSAPTGYLNLSSKAPTAEDAIRVGLTGGIENRVRATVDTNLALEGAWGAALRFNAMYDASDKPGRDYAENRRWGFAPSVAFGLGSDTRFYANYLFVAQENLPDGGIPSLGFPGYSNTLFGTVVAPRVDTSNFYGSPSDFDDVEVNMITTRIEHDLGANATLRNVTRYGRTNQQYVLTGINAIAVPNLANPASWTVTRSRQGKDQINEVLTNQSGLVSSFATGAVTHDLSGGFEIIQERQRALGFTTSGTTSNANLYNPSTADSFARVVPSGAVTDGKTLTAALYAVDTLHFGPKWLLTVGARFERYKTEYSSKPATTVAVQTTALLEDADDLFSGKLGLVYKPLENASLYATVASSQQPPGGTNFTLSSTATNVNSPNLDPQEGLNFEVGTKWDLLDNRLVLTGAAYRTINKNDQAVVDTVTGEVDQYGERRVQGLELGAAGMITPAWQVSAGVSFMDTEVVQGAITSTTQNGAQINFSPKFAFTSWTTYKFPFGLTLGGGARHVASQTTQINNGTAAITNLPRIPSYWVMDLMASYEVTPKLGLQLNALNLADELYIVSVNNGRSRYVLGPPRTVQLTLNYRLY